jgi:hypothetical protein
MATSTFKYERYNLTLSNFLTNSVSPVIADSQESCKSQFIATYISPSFPAHQVAKSFLMVPNLLTSHLDMFVNKRDSLSNPNKLKLQNKFTASIGQKLVYAAQDLLISNSMGMQRESINKDKRTLNIKLSLHLEC